MTIRTTLISLFFLLASGSATAYDLEEGITLYWSGQYAETIEVLTLAQQGDLRDDEKIECMKYIAFSHIAVGETDAAHEVFLKLLESDPAHVLDESMTSPKLVRQFEASRAQLVNSLFEEGKSRYFDKDYAATRRTMKRVLTLDPEHTLAQEYDRLASEQEVIIQQAAAAPTPEPATEAEAPEPEDRVYHQTGDITPPVLVSRVNPRYPASARRQGKQGTVVMTLVVDHDGTVAEARTVRSLDPLLDEAALDAVRQWRYRPARMGTRNVAVYSVVKLEFQLER